LTSPTSCTLFSSAVSLIKNFLLSKKEAVEDSLGWLNRILVGSGES